MRFFVALIAAAALLHVTAADSFAQHGKGGYGSGYRAPSFARHGGYGHGGCYGCGYGYGYHGHGGHHGNLHYLTHGYNFNNVPMLQPPAYMAGPPSPTVVYPYYTTRGPRDFLLGNPPSIGP